MSEQIENFNYNKVAEASTRNPKKYDSFNISNEVLSASTPSKGEEPKLEDYNDEKVKYYNKLLKNKNEIAPKSRFSADKVRLLIAREFQQQKNELAGDYDEVYEKATKHKLNMPANNSEGKKAYITSPLAINIYNFTKIYTGKTHPSGYDVRLIINAIKNLENYYVCWLDKETKNKIFSRLISIDQIETPQDNPEISSTIFHISLYPIFTRKLESSYSTAQTEVIRDITKSHQLKLYELLLRAPKYKPFTKDSEELFRLIFSRGTKSDKPKREREEFWQAIEFFKGKKIITECKEGEGMLTFYFE